MQIKNILERDREQTGSISRESKIARGKSDKKRPTEKGYL